LLCGTADIVSFNHETKSFIIDDIKSWKQKTSDRVKHASEQITLYAWMWSKLLNVPCEVGGVVMFESYYTLRQDTPLVFVPLRNKQREINPGIWAREYFVKGLNESLVDTATPLV
jgi:hypothetical protein